MGEHVGGLQKAAQGLRVGTDHTEVPAAGCLGFSAAPTPS